MKTSICCIAKCENDYLVEWVEYHLNLGFNHIYIYDNNDEDGERIEEVLGTYINTNVFVVNCRGLRAYQVKAYTEFYTLYGNDYDWIAYIDVDEFVTFSEKSGIKNINDYLDTIHGFDIIHLNWMCYGDNDIVDYTSNSVLERFTKPLPFDKHIQYDFPENFHVKSIIKGRLNLTGVEIVPHSPSGNFRICDENGIKRIENTYFKPYSYEVIYIRHYVTKTIYEWFKKVSRGIATSNSYSYLYPIERFFKYNIDTNEKRRVIRDFLFYKNITLSQYKTECDILKEDLDILKDENTKLRKEISQIRLSKAYRIGKFLLRPFSYIK